MRRPFQTSYGKPRIARRGLRTILVLLILPPACFAAPKINSIVNAATFGSVGPAAGSLATIFGTELATSVMNAGSLPLPQELATTSVRVGGVLAPLLYVSPTQINFQVPWEVCCPGGGVAVTVSVGVRVSNVFTMGVEPFGPAIFSIDSLTGQGAILIANTDIYAAPEGSVPGASSRPAIQGEFVSLYCIGLGPVTNLPPSGTAATRDPLSLVFGGPVQVLIGGIIVEATFAGLAPDFVGLYQVNFQIPSDAPIGPRVPITITISNLPLSSLVRIAVD